MEKSNQEKLLDHYKKVEVNLPKGLFNASKVEEYLRNNIVSNGVCRCALIVFGVYIMDDDWVRRNFVKGTNWWGAPPNDKFTAWGMRRAFRKRIKILSKEVEILKQITTN